MATAILPDTKEIRYSRETHDFDAHLNGQYIGSFATYLAAEVALDHVLSDQIADTLVMVADESGDPPVDDPCPPPWDTAGRNCGGTHQIQMCD